MTSFLKANIGSAILENLSMRGQLVPVKWPSSMSFFCCPNQLIVNSDSIVKQKNIPATRAKKRTRLTKKVTGVMIYVLFSECSSFWVSGSAWRYRLRLTVIFRSARDTSSAWFIYVENHLQNLLWFPNSLGSPLIDSNPPDTMVSDICNRYPLVHQLLHNWPTVLISIFKLVFQRSAFLGRISL